MSHVTSSSIQPQGPAGSRSGDQPRRIYKTMPPLEPLDQERRYVQTHVSHVSVFTGFFSWALRINRLGNRAHRRVKVDTRSMGVQGSFSGMTAGRGGRFTNYFSLGTAQDHRPRETSHELNVHRNRVIFLGILTVAVVYTLVWITS